MAFKWTAIEGAFLTFGAQHFITETYKLCKIHTHTHLLMDATKEQKKRETAERS